MNFMQKDRETLEKFLPGLDEKLKTLSFEQTEKKGNPAIAIYRDSRGPCVLIPKEYGGLGASAAEGIRIHRALGSRSPSLALAVTMHNFTIAFLVEYTLYGEETKDMCRQVSEHSLYLASGFAEGKHNANVLTPSMTATPTEGGYLLNGSKKPLSLTHSMDILTASVMVQEPTGNRRALAVVPAQVEGLERHPFWNNAIMGGAENDHVELKDVFLPQEYLFFPDVEEDLDAVEAGGLIWFQLMVTASYVGVVSSLLERVLEKGNRGTAEGRVSAAMDLECATQALVGLALEMDAGERSPDLLARALYTRYSIQERLPQVALSCAEMLGGMDFINNPDVSMLLGAARLLAYHPPGRIGTVPSLDHYLNGGPLKMV